MAKFIEVHSEGEASLVNVERVKRVTITNGTCAIYIEGNKYICADEGYNAVREMIASATGGIPMPPGKPRWLVRR